MARKRPNFLVIIADDLGYSDIGAYASEIATPNLDSLAAQGLKLLNYHTAAACSPTRAMVLSGTDAHKGGLGCLLEFKMNPKSAQRWNGKAGYEGFLNGEVVRLPEVLKDNGYRTVLSGKWHLGLRPEYGPAAMGFDRSFAMLPGCCSHYGWEPVLEAGVAGMPLGGRPIHAEDGKAVHIKPNTTGSEDGFYSSRAYADKFIEYLDEQQGDEPWFGYLAFSAPHWPLQAPKSIRERYRGMYDDGPHALRERRLAALVDAGLIDAATIPHPVVAPDVPEWDSFTDYEKACSSRAMEAYAAMVTSMDQQIGRVFEKIKERGEWEDTFVVFMSDNGAEGAAYEAIPVLGENIKKAIHEFYDNSLDNIGEWNSYTWLGPLWAQASTAPSRLYKMFPSEGGILVPCIVKPPSDTFAHNWTPGGVSRAFTTCMDLAPTFLDLAGVHLQPAAEGRVMHRGRKVHAMQGLSWVPWFGRNERVDATSCLSSSAVVVSATPNGPAPTDDPATQTEDHAIYPPTRPVGWELDAMAALRKGDYKLVHLRDRYGGLAKHWDTHGDDPRGWELFNVKEDPGETRNVAEEQKEKFEELMADWEVYVAECGLVWGPGALDDGKPREEMSEGWDNDVEMQRTWIQVPPGGEPVF